MLEIRVNYLKFRQIEAKYESPAFKASEKAGLASYLKPVLKNGYALQKRYCKLNKGYLKHPERSFGSWNYLGQMQNVYDNLTN